ncbi:MAG TPA: hypothetical protein GX506_00530, partial [Firmicutes bacterium]|nr:hypothetical protein [Bacillota bacterium]
MELRKVKLNLWIAALVALFVGGIAAASLAVEPSPAGDDARSASFASNIIAAYPDLNLSVEYVEGLRAN